MKNLHWLRLAAIVAAAVTVANPFIPVEAAIFSQQEVDQSKFVTVASPYGQGNYQLLILEQVSNTRACWNAPGQGPGVVEPLLQNFNFTGICGRSTDSNGYSIRTANTDLGLEYTLRILKRNGDLVLVGAPIKNRNAPEIEIGRSYGVTAGFPRIILNPGWRLAKRVYNGRTLGHVYLTNDTSLANLIANSAKTITPVSTTPTQTAPIANPAGSIPIPVPPPESNEISKIPSANSVRTETPVSSPVLIPVPPATGNNGTRRDRADVVVPTVQTPGSSASSGNTKLSNSGDLVLPTVEIWP